MEWMLDAMVLMSPVGLAILGCVAFGFALAAREALGRERGLREAAERARNAAVKTLAGTRDWEMQEIGRYRRLLDCHVDALIAEATEFRERSVPSPGAIIESLCSWHASWKQDLATCAGLEAEHVERLLKNDLPITPSLAHRLELFTGAPARYWEYLWHLHDEYRLEADATLVAGLGEVTRAREVASRAPTPALIPPSAPAPAPPPAPPPVNDEPGPSMPATRRDQRRVLEIVDDSPTTLMAVPMFPPSPVAAAAPSAPLPPVPRLRYPGGAGSGSTPARRASTLTDFPIQSGDAPSPGGDGRAEAERSPPSAPLRGVTG